MARLFNTICFEDWDFDGEICSFSCFYFGEQGVKYTDLISNSCSHNKCQAKRLEVLGKFCIHYLALFLGEVVFPTS